MPNAISKRLEWTRRARGDLDTIFAYYAEVAPAAIAEQSIDAIRAQARKICRNPELYRRGKRGTRECVMQRFPYTVVYRIHRDSVEILRVLHQARSYFSS
ncbi:MAG: type II toxin-antitoxin system RelE/ParE family toxin [Sulfuritalea sp.]|nr:type II toxin-antitoxin system RelE/ParE family toxin [Sulfuritalea sp.]